MMNKPIAERLVARFKKEGKTDDEWLQLYNDMDKFPEEDVPPEMRKWFKLYKKMTFRRCDNIHLRNGTGWHTVEAEEERRQYYRKKYGGSSKPGLDGILERLRDKKRQRGFGEDDYLKLMEDIQQYLRENPSEKEKNAPFGPFDWIEVESLAIICDGIERRRASICGRCRKKHRYEFSGSCEEYESIPKEIWTVKDGECPYFEPCQDKK